MAERQTEPEKPTGRTNFFDRGALTNAFNTAAADSAEPTSDPKPQTEPEKPTDETNPFDKGALTNAFNTAAADSAEPTSDPEPDVD